MLILARPILFFVINISKSESNVKKIAGKVMLSLQSHCKNFQVCQNCISPTKRNSHGLTTRPKEILVVSPGDHKKFLWSYCKHFQFWENCIPHTKRNSSGLVVSPRAFLISPRGARGEKDHHWNFMQKRVNGFGGSNGSPCFTHFVLNIN